MSLRIKRKFLVTAIVANIKQYRTSFYVQLQESLREFDVELKVLYSESDSIERKKEDSIDLPPSIGRKIPRWYLANNRLLIQFPRISDITRSDLVIIVQANGYLLNYPLLLLSFLGIKKVAFWGHGFNHQGKSSSISERLKRRLVNSTDWWFAYTNETARYLRTQGVNNQKITPIENAIDTRVFRSEVMSVTATEISSTKRHLGLSENNRIGLYCGSLYLEKMIPYLLNVAERVACTVPEFRLLIIGAGNEAERVRKFSKTSKVICYTGPLFGRDKAVCFRMAEVFLNPGAVGLGILDSFASELPIVTTTFAKHGPEIAYLEHGVNGLMLNGDEETFSNGVVTILQDSSYAHSLKRGAADAARRYTVENMVGNVRNGVLTCLGIPSGKEHSIQESV